MSDGRDALGRTAEDLAARYLARLGYRIVARREQILRGDIDLIALDGRTVVFVEVRARSDLDHGHPAESIDGRKQRRIAELATAYVRRHRLEECPLRIDVVTVLFQPDAAPPRVEHFPDAFESPL